MHFLLAQLVVMERFHINLESVLRVVQYNESYLFR